MENTNETITLPNTPELQKFIESQNLNKAPTSENPPQLTNEELALKEISDLIEALKNYKENPNKSFLVVDYTHDKEEAKIISINSNPILNQKLTAVANNINFGNLTNYVQQLEESKKALSEESFKSATGMDPITLMGKLNEMKAKAEKTSDEWDNEAYETFLEEAKGILERQRKLGIITD